MKQRHAALYRFVIAYFLLHQWVHPGATPANKIIMNDSFCTFLLIVGTSLYAAKAQLAHASDCYAKLLWR
jgi:hypothetical protein